MSSTANTSASRASVYVPPAKRALARLSAFRAPSTLMKPVPAHPAPIHEPTPQVLGVASFPIPACRTPSPTPVFPTTERKKTPLSRTLSAHSLLERQEEQEEAQVLTAIRVDAENPLWMVPLLDRVETATAAKPKALAVPRVVRAPSPSPLKQASSPATAAAAPALIEMQWPPMPTAAAPTPSSAQFPTEKRRISIVTDLPTFPTRSSTRANRTRTHTPTSAFSTLDSAADASDVIDISRPSSRASTRSDASYTSSLFSAVSRSTAASSTWSSPVSPKALPLARTRSATPALSSSSSTSGSDCELSEDDMEMEVYDDEKDAVVVIDAAHRDVKNYLYAGGKTNVLGGGVMLGVAKTPTSASPSSSPSPSNRRSALLSALQGRLQVRSRA